MSQDDHYDLIGDPHVKAELLARRHTSVKLDLPDHGPRPDKVMVRIAVYVAGDGQWAAHGTPDPNTDDLRANDEALAAVWLDSDKERQLYYVTAELPIPRAKTVRGDIDD